jgi:UPF0716 protein FxsA
MIFLVLLAFIGVPLVEIAVFIEIGGILGLWPTLGVVIGTAIVGTTLLRHQGMATLGRARSILEAGRIPMAEVFDGVCLLLAGALLLTPGFVTDLAGLLLFVPALRSALRLALARHLTASGRTGARADGFAGHGDRGDATVIEGEFEVVDRDDAEEEEDGKSPPASRLGPRRSDDGTGRNSGG